MATELAVETEHNWIGGEWVPAQSGRTFENRNPADRDDLVGVFPESDRRDVDAAVEAAKRAFPGWRDTPAPRRAEVLYAAGEILKRDKEKLARLMTREMGKVLKETRGDVQEGIDMAYYMGGEGRRLFGYSVPVELPNKSGVAMREYWHCRARAGNRSDNLFMTGSFACGSATRSSLRRPRND